MFEQYRLHDNILCIDFKSYYATVECIKRGLDPFKTMLCVANHENGPSAVCLAISPALKAAGFSGRPRLRNLLDVEGLIVVKPHMADYINKSIEILKIYLNYVAREDIYVYSIDEAFLDVTNYIKLYNKSDYELAKIIMDDVYKKTKILSTCGIGPNMLIAKFALDIESKHTKDMIAKWDYADLQEKLWPIMKMRDVWSIGFNKQRRLNKMGLFTIGDIANCDVKLLVKEFGIMGEELYLHANGIDISKVNTQDLRKRKSISRAQTLNENYYNEHVLNILLELNYEVVLELQKLKRYASMMTVAWNYEMGVNVRGFSRTFIINSTNSFMQTSEYIKHYFKLYYLKNTGVRKITISFSKLNVNQILQYDLFNPVKDSKANLEKTLLEIRTKHGDDAARLSLSYANKAIGKKRSKLIGGHNA